MEVSGQGLVDYIVVGLCVVATLWGLAGNKWLVLLLLPTFLSIEFFIPVISNLTPGRIIPLILGIWLIFFNPSKMQAGLSLWVIWTLLAIGLSLLIAVLLGDSGVRPLVRVFFYLGLVATLVFVTMECRTSIQRQWCLRGFALAAAIHSAYGIYQVLAFKLGLPFRGIARTFGADVASVGTSLRVNGFASEPKRLGFVLMAGAIAAILLGLRARKKSRYIWWIIAATAIGASVLTYSASYFLAVAIAIVLVGVSSHRLILPTVGFVLLSAALVVSVPFLSSRVIDEIPGMLEARMEEVETGLDGKLVYRQEFFAEEFIKSNPGAAVLGLGMGRYYRVLRDTYGPGVGLSQDGVLLPLNSQPSEVAFDLGLLGLVLVYGGGIWCLFRLLLPTAQHCNGMTRYFMYGLVLFLLVQSLFVQSLPLLAVAVGATLPGILDRRPRAITVSAKRKKVMRTGRSLIPQIGGFENEQTMERKPGGVV